MKDASSASSFRGADRSVSSIELDIHNRESARPAKMLKRGETHVQF